MVVNDVFDAILLGCFFFGVLTSVVTLVIGDGWDLFEIGGGDGDGGVPINLSSILAFLAWFGGVAYLARNAGGWPTAGSAGAGIAGGLLGAAAVSWVAAKIASPKDAELDPRAFRLPGTIARVSSSIRDGGTGEVIYEQAGVRQVAAARAKDGLAIGRGSEVVVLESRNGIALVERSDTFFGDDLSGVGAGGATAMHPEQRE